MCLGALPWCLFCVVLTSVLSTEIDEVIRVHSVITGPDGDKLLSKGIVGQDTIVGVYTLESNISSFRVPRISAARNVTGYDDARVKTVEQLLYNLTEPLKELFGYICVVYPPTLQLSYICYPTETNKTYAALRLARNGYYVAGVHLMDGTLKEVVASGIHPTVGIEALKLFSVLTPNNRCLQWNEEFTDVYRKPKGISYFIVS